MIDSYKKLIGTLLLLILGTICFIAVKMYCPEFYDMTISLTLAGDVEGLSAYISSFGYGAFVVSILLLIICNILGIPTIPFLTINGALFGIIPGIIPSTACGLSFFLSLRWAAFLCKGNIESISITITTDSHFYGFFYF